jgi:phospholipid/cholesterol/gamma-HCH transport system permease protein
MSPALTLAGILVGIIGGLVVAVTALDLPPIAYWNELTRALRMLDFAEGLLKSLVFAVVITFIACQRGLATRGGAAGVGASTTSSVVTTLFHLIAIDAILATLFNTLR